MARLPFECLTYESHEPLRRYSGNFLGKRVSYLGSPLLLGCASIHFPIQHATRGWGLTVTTDPGVKNAEG